MRSSRRGDSGEVARVIRSARPDLYILTNDQILERFSRVEFSYFQQISFVLVTITLFFGFLLIAVLLTVSVNQRLGEIAALRAIGLSRGRVMAGVLCESAIIVLTGESLDGRSRARLAGNVSEIVAKGDFDQSAFVALVQSHYYPSLENLAGT